MLWNRSLLVKVVKDDAVVDKTDTDYTPTFREIARGCAALIAVYMASDTLRKVIVHTVATKIV